MDVHVHVYAQRCLHVCVYKCTSALTDTNVSCLICLSGCDRQVSKRLRPCLKIDENNLVPDLPLSSPCHTVPGLPSEIWVSLDLLTLHTQSKPGGEATLTDVVLRNTEMIFFFLVQSKNKRK